MLDVYAFTFALGFVKHRYILQSAWLFISVEELKEVLVTAIGLGEKRDQTIFTSDFRLNLLMWPLRGRKFFYTTGGYIGLGPSMTEPGTYIPTIKLLAPRLISRLRGYYLHSSWVSLSSFTTKESGACRRESI